MTDFFAVPTQLPPEKKSKPKKGMFSESESDSEAGGDPFKKIPEKNPAPVTGGLFGDSDSDGDIFAVKIKETAEISHEAHEKVDGSIKQKKNDIFSGTDDEKNTR